MIKTIFEAIMANKIYTVVVLLLLGWFSYQSLIGVPYFKDSGVQMNAGYTGPIPHSGYGTRFYHK